MLRQRAPLLRALTDQTIGLLWGGLALSAVGDQLFTVVLNWVAVGTLGAAAGYLAVLQAAIASATVLLSGRWVDLIGQTRVMIGADLVRAMVLAVTIVAWLSLGKPPAWSLALCVVVLALGASVFRPAMQSSLPVLAQDASMLPAANALLDTTDRLARLVGPGLVGLTSAVVPLVHFFTIDLASFLASASVVAFVSRRIKVPPASTRRREPILEGVVRGFRAVRRQPLLWFVLMRSGVLNGAWYAAFFLALPLVIQEQGIGGLSAYGLVISCYGCTNVLSTLVVGNRALPRQPWLSVFGGNMVVGTGTLALGLVALLSPSCWMLAGFGAAAGLTAIGGPMQDIIVATLRQTELPRQDLPAAVRAFMLMNNAGLLVTMAVVPGIVHWIGAGATIVGCGLVYLGAASMGLAKFARPG